MSDFLDKLLKGANPQKRRRPTDPETLSRQTVDNDRWDREEFNKILAQQREVSVARQKLADTIAGELGFDVAPDMFWALWKAYAGLLGDPEIRPTRLLNKRVLEEAEKLNEYLKLRRWTVGDPISAALGFEKMEPTLEILYDRLQEQIRQQEQYEQALQAALQARADAMTVEDLIAQWQQENEAPEGDEPAPPDEMIEALSEAQQLAFDAESEAEKQLIEFQAALDGIAGEIREQLAAGMNQANDSLETLNNMAAMWGTEPGELKRLPAARRIELARRLNSDPKFEKMARLIGAFAREAFAEQKRKVVVIPEEIVDVTVGDDLPRVLPSELARLRNPRTRTLFLKDLVEKQLPQYEMKGYEKIARGGIIYCHDGSGSMSGEREQWAKGIGGALLHIARKQKRSFYGIQFGSAHQIRIDDFRDTRKITPEKVIDFFEYFFGGGTDFMSPLRHALTILEREHAEFGAVQADIVFATDGCAPISDQFMHDFKEKQKKLEFKVYGIQIGIGGRDETRTEPLYTLCDGNVATLHSLLNAHDVRTIFRAL